VDRRKIDLDQPLKALGEFNVPIKLHKEVTVQIKVTITKQEEPTA
jgi:large subunit ribosomal protein L9